MLGLRMMVEGGRSFVVVEVDKSFDKCVRILVGIMLVAMARASHDFMGLGARNRKFIYSLRSESVDLGGLIKIKKKIDRHADGLFDADPMIQLGDRCSGFVDATVLLGVFLSSYLVLSLRVADNFFIFEHQALLAFLTSFCGNELVVRGCTAQARFFGAISTIWVFSMLEVEAYLVETLFRDKVFAFGTKVTTVYNGINELVWMRAKITAGFDAANALEAQSVPYSARRDIGLVDKVEDRIGISLDRNEYDDIVSSGMFK